MAYFLGRDIAVGLSTEQPNYGIKYADANITISNTSSTSGDLGGAYSVDDAVPRRTATTEVSTITHVKEAKGEYDFQANQYVLIYDADGKSYLIWYNSDGSGTAPDADQDYSLEVDISSTTTNETIADAVVAQGNADSDFSAAFTFTDVGGEGVVTVTSDVSGRAVDIAKGSGFTDHLTVATTTEGTGAGANSVSDNDELKVDDLTSIDFTFGATDEDIAYVGQRTALKAEIKKEISLVLTRKKKNALWDELWAKARCGVRATTNVSDLAGGSDNVAFDNNLNSESMVDVNGSAYGYRAYLQLKDGTEVLTLPNMCISEHTTTMSTDGVQEETLTLYGNVTPDIQNSLYATTTTQVNF